jgi:hypothetical protein
MVRHLQEQGLQAEAFDTQYGDEQAELAVQTEHVQSPERQAQADLIATDRSDQAA